mmetsp:Transcript_54966/g.159107  ORF Transcript_54966/g.159107 Transcript_54966/m.159107 type:complete len:232 (+) Transcript_54966:678-1373(+)
MPVRTAEAERGHLAMAPVVREAGALRLEEGVELGVLQVRVEEVEVIRRAALRRLHLQHALHDGAHGSSSLQVPHVRLDAPDHQRLRPRLLDLHLAHRADLDGVAKSRAGAMAFPHRGLRRLHLRLTNRAPNALLLRWAVRRGEARGAPVLVRIRATEQTVRILPDLAILHDEAVGAIASLVSVGGGVECEATAGLREHVRLGAADKAADIDEQLRPQRQAELQGVPIPLQQ